MQEFWLRAENIIYNNQDLILILTTNQQSVLK